MSTKPSAPTRGEFTVFREITTRWMDNDHYGHVNNATYYSFLDTIVTGHLIDTGCIDPGRGPVIGLTVSSSCAYFAPISYPETVVGGLRVARIGNSSVEYQVGLFSDDQQTAAALGSFTHVYVDSETRRPVPLPDKIKSVLTPLLVG